MTSKKGFTLLEVLIALSLLSISMLGIFTLVHQSLNTNMNAEKRLLLIQKGYERVLLETYYSDLVTSDTETVDNKTVLKYLVNRTPTLIPGITESTLDVENEGTNVRFFFYEKAQ